MSLRLDDQLCFRLYAASRAIQARYRPHLNALGITYPQYLVLMVLWEHETTPMKALAARLRLDSGTLTPLLKRMETHGLVERTRDAADARNIIVTLTEQGRTLEDRARPIPMNLCETDVDADLESLDLPALAASLDQLLATLEDR